MKVSSEFLNNGEIPVGYTCDGGNMIPPLKVSNISSDAKTLVLIMDDPDAPSKVWVHWILFDIPVSSSEVEIKDASLGKEGLNDFEKVGYNGPCPPSGLHHYHFRVYALDSEIGLSKGVGREEIDSAMKGKVLEKSELIGVYKK